MTSRILVGSQIRHHEVKEWLKLHDIHIDHVMIQPELQDLIGVKVGRLKCVVFGRQTGPCPKCLVFCSVRPVPSVRLRVKPDPDPTRTFGHVGDTWLWGCLSQSDICESPSANCFLVTGRLEECLRRCGVQT